MSLSTPRHGRLVLLTCVSMLAVGAAAAPPAGAANRAPVEVVFRYNGTNGTDGSPQRWTVPAGVRLIAILAAGAQGGRNAYGNAGGKGAVVRALIRVAPGAILTIYVGGRPAFNNAAALGGFDGGGAPGVQGLPLTIIPGGGGGASDVRRGAATLADRVLVAGGGGGAGAPASTEWQSQGVPSSGGAGGGSGSVGGQGQPVGTVYDAGQGGGPGTLVGGGAGGTGGYSDGGCGFDGRYGDLGAGAPSSGSVNYSGAGGGGFYGGGSGGTGGCSSSLFYVSGAGGGGGGSSLVPSGGTLSDGQHAGQGVVIITYRP